MFSHFIPFIIAATATLALNFVKATTEEEKELKILRKIPNLLLSASTLFFTHTEKKKKAHKGNFTCVTTHEFLYIFLSAQILLLHFLGNTIGVKAAATEEQKGPIRFSSSLLCARIFLPRSRLKKKEEEEAAKRPVCIQLLHTHSLTHSHLLPLSRACSR